MSQVMVVAPHPDDETLGCGGTLLRHAAQGDEIHWLIMTQIDGESGFSPECIERRSKEIDRVAAAYGFSTVHQLNFTTTCLDTYPRGDLVSAVSTMITQVQPEILYLPYRNDIHSDHAAVFDAVASCTKSFRYPSLVSVRVYETLSETEFSIRPDDGGFKPNLWINISDHLDEKIEIMKLYKGEIGEHPFPRSEKNISALAALRGATAGVGAAESFMCVIERVI